MLSGSSVIENGHLIRIWGTAIEITEKIKTQAALEASQERLALATSAAQVGIWDWHITENELIWDEAMYALYGLTADKFEGTYETWVQGVHPEDLPQSEADVHAALRGEKDFHTEFRVIWPDGTIRHMQGSAAVHRDETGKPIRMVGVNWDVTERVLAREKLQQSEEKYRTLFENINEGFALHEVLVDQDGVPCDYRFLEINPAFESMTKLDRNDVIGKTVREVFPWIEDDPADWIGRYGQVALTGESIHFDDYSEPIERWYQVNAFSPQKGQFATTFTDISERKAAEQEILRLSAIVEQVESPFILTDLAGTIEYVNPAFERITGFSAAEAIGQNPRILKSGLMPPEYYKTLWSTIMAGGQINEVVINQKKNGEIWHYDQTIVPMRDSDGTITHFVSTGKDITTEVLAKEALKVSEERLTLAINAAQVGIWDWDLQNDIIIWDDAMYAFYGTSTQDGRDPNEIWQNSVHPDDLTQADGAVHSALRGDQDFNAEFRVVWPDGSIRYIRGMAVVHRDEDNQALRMVGVNWDITEWKRSETERTRITKRLEEAQKIAQMGSWEWEIGSNKNIWSNQTYRLFGYEPDEVQVSFETFISHVHPDDRDKVIQANQQAVNGNIPYNIEFRIIRKDGNERIVHSHGEINLDEAGNPHFMVGTVQDITAQKQAAILIRENEERLSLVFNSTNEFMALIKVTDETSFQIETLNQPFIDANKQAGAIFELDNVIGMEIETFMREIVKVPSEKIQFILSKYQETINMGASLEYEELTELPDGSIYVTVTAITPLFDDNGTCNRLLYNARDITARKNAEIELQTHRDHLADLVAERTAELAASESKYRAIVEDQTEFLVRFKPDSTLTFVNQSYCQHRKISADALIGIQIIDYLPVSAREYFLKQLAALTPANPIFENEFQATPDSGEAYWEQWSNRGIFDENGQIVEYQAVGRNITEQKVAEEALRQRTAEIEMFNQVMVGREERIIEMKEEVNRLCLELGREIEYPPVWNET